MGVKSDRWIRRMAREHRMIEPFAEDQVREGVISYGVSSYGYVPGPYSRFTEGQLDNFMSWYVARMQAHGY